MLQLQWNWAAGKLYSPNITILICYYGISGHTFPQAEELISRTLLTDMTNTHALLFSALSLTWQ
jgi:hypothetical protein